MDADYYRLVAEVEDEHWWYDGRRKIFSAVLDRLSLPAGARILDVGCGTGGNLEMLTGYGTLSAMEMDSFAREIAVDRGVCEVVGGSLPGDVPFAHDSFDVVTAFDVIEHVEDDRAAVDVMRQLLAPDGRLIVSVPAYQFLWSQHDEVNQHYRRYTRSALSNLLRAGGLEVVRSTYFNTLLFPAIAGVRLAGRLRPSPRERSDMDPPAVPLNGLLKRIFSTEAHLVAATSLPFGVSLLAVARRP